MKFPRRNHVATQLKDSRVLITGGIQLRGTGFGASPNTEIYDSATNQFSASKPMIEGRWMHTATLLTAVACSLSADAATTARATARFSALDSAKY